MCLRSFKGTSSLTFDNDVLVCALISNSMGLYISKGFDPQKIFQLIQGFKGNVKIVTLEVSKINLLSNEKGNRMAEATLEVANLWLTKELNYFN